MWIFTNKGFISVVKDRNSEDMLLIRAREKGVLQELFPDYRFSVAENDNFDYRFRISIPRITFKPFMENQIKEIKYDNFKNSIPPEKKVYHDACMDVWSTMHRLQEGLKISRVK